MLGNASKCSSINIYDHDQRHRRPTTETHCPSGTFERNARLVQYFQPIHNEIVASMNIYDHDQRHRRPTTETHCPSGTFERNARLDASESPWPGCGQMVPLVEASVSGLSLFHWRAFQGHHTAPTYGRNARLGADRWSR
ncbi:hypothetical protein DPMN_102445 [Dreissena polymorpha]|uniref:Uncharacterized protein n=1 Tax=Dreissena polymorpha TaxID=45954 RepID=A0A9D4LJ26_DREPO|nr:hypothetical protein DPMN_102445 [Dreissena polymorpha]